MFRTTRRLFLAAGSVLAIALAASPGAAQDTLTLAWSPAPQMPQIDVALAEDLFAKAGLDVSVVTFASGREAFEALTGGQADLATMAELPAVTGALRDQRFAIVADLARYRGSRVIAKASSGIAAPADLAGRRIGVTLGTNTDFLLGKILGAAGVTAEIVNAAPADLVPALLRGDVDAIVPFPNAYPAAARALGEDYREIRSDLYEPHFVLAASPAALDGKSEAVTRFLDAVVEADGSVAADPDAAAEAVVATVQGNIDAAAVRALWQDTEIGARLDDRLLDLMAEQGAWIVGRGVVKADAPSRDSLRPFLEPAPLAAVAPDAVRLPRP
ncbi:ABC transporter substrate-binding protein [Aureimonas flava]|uniref:ABC transporter substrate-binding protein n=1 Tax=Aureimonas flava TaxID=2320271 RepID=A0A3A1WP28_9HYPH|nr:NrtA/SsuA/CpmA family ABC transporter substrate-binding protein [Aureimonas flava]RIY02495.1 ABC transporter substrate-binding protein [Aureimonas flava]